VKGFVGLARSFLLFLVFATDATSCWPNDKQSLPNAPAPTVIAIEAQTLNSFLRPLSAAGPQDVSQTRALSEHKPATRSGEYQHRFWDRENIALFTAVGASRALDYASTLNMRRRGRQEALLTNDIVDNHAAFAAIEAGGTAVSIGASYLFHRYHHHRLERWTSVVHASLTTSGAIRNYCLQTAPTSSTP
jgi:hypothetical protein